MSAAIAWETVPSAESATELTGLFQTVFGHAMAERQWAWKYANPRSLHVVARDTAGRCVAHAGLQYGGALASGGWVGQVCDVMVHPNARGRLQSGLFAQMVQRLAHQARDRGYRVCYGFPGERPALLGIRLGVYQELMRPREVVLAPPAPGPGWRRWLQGWWTSVQPLSPDEATALMSAVQGDRRAVRRGPAYVQWRYAEGGTPHGFWRVAHGKGVALAVTRVQDDGTLRLVDWLAAGLPCRADGLQRLSARAGQPVVAWSVQVQGEAGAVGGQERPSPVVVIRLADVGTPADAALWLQDVQAGDVDIY